MQNTTHPEIIIIIIKKHIGTRKSEKFLKQPLVPVVQIVFPIVPLKIAFFEEHMK